MKKILLSCFLTASLFYSAQTELVFVFFKDKPNKAAFYANPTTELSQKSINRRTSQGIPLNDQDAPIEASYIQNIRNLGFTVTDTSKWLNGVAVNATTAQIAELASQPYVQNVESFVKARKQPTSETKKNKFDVEKTSSTVKASFNYGTGATQIDQVNIRPLHVNGFTGTGVTIAVLDTGFPTVDTGSAYARMRDNGHIKGGYNFINKNSDLYNTAFNSHGAVCLGIIGGYIDGSFVGSAPDADFYLYVTESGPTEIPEEELYWIQAAEDADRNGVDIISASLGYGDAFDDARYNYIYGDMTGTRSFVARGAQIAAEKGILVFAANGNEAQKPWQYLLTPADNAKVFSIGAVSSTGTSSSFSSFGPNAAGVVKPDGSALGTGTATVYNNTTTSGSGTSLATPVAAGGAACLIQALASSVSSESVKNKLRETASLYPNTDAQQGYGILNFYSAYNSLVLATKENSIQKNLKIYPNPVSNQINIQTSEKIESVELYDSLGRKVQTLKAEKQNTINGISKGVYFLKVKTDKNNYIEKIIKQ